MNKKLNSLFALLILVFYIFFIGIENVNAIAENKKRCNYTNGYEKIWCLGKGRDEKHVEVPKAETQSLEDSDIPIESVVFAAHDGELYKGYFYQCYYKLYKESLDSYDFGYVVIKYNPNKDRFYFGAGFLDNNGLKDVFFEATVAYKDLTINTLPYSPDKGAFDSKMSYAPYIRFRDEDSQAVVDKLKTGICPGYVTVTGGDWTDKNGLKRICFSNDSKECAAQLGGSFNNNDAAVTASSGNGTLYQNTGRAVNNAINSATNKLKKFKVDSDCTDLVAKSNELVEKSNELVKTYVQTATDYITLNGKYASNFEDPSFNIDGSAMFKKAVKAYQDKYDEKSENISKYCPVVNQGDAEKAQKILDEGADAIITMINEGGVVGWGEPIKDCKGLKDTDFYKYLEKAFTAIKIAVPILTLVLISKDMISAVIAGKEDDMKKAQKNSVIRLIVGVMIFLLPTLVKIIINLADQSNSCNLD